MGATGKRYLDSERSWGYERDTAIPSDVCRSRGWRLGKEEIQIGTSNLGYKA